jgi:Flp pilus assembly protein TadG
MVGRRLAAGRRRLRGILGETGAAVVEFAIVGPLFLLMILVTLQLCMIIFMNQALQTATYATGRQYMTGQMASYTSMGSATSGFQQQVCQNLLSVFNCNNVMIDIEVANSASTLNESPPNLYVCSGSGPTLSCHTTAGNFAASQPQQFAILRIYYPFPSIMGGFFSNEPDGTYVMVGTSVFLVEPYTS